MSATIRRKPRYADKDDFSVKDGEKFLTVAIDKMTGLLVLFNPDRERAGLVALAEDHVAEIFSDRVAENEIFKVWGEKEA